MNGLRAFLVLWIVISLGFLGYGAYEYVQEDDTDSDISVNDTQCIGVYDAVFDPLEAECGSAFLSEVESCASTYQSCIAPCDSTIVNTTLCMAKCDTEQTNCVETASSVRESCIASAEQEAQAAVSDCVANIGGGTPGDTGSTGDPTPVTCDAGTEPDGNGGCVAVQPDPSAGPIIINPNPNQNNDGSTTSTTYTQPVQCAGACNGTGYQTDFVAGMSCFGDPNVDNGAYADTCFTCSATTGNFEVNSDRTQCESHAWRKVSGSYVAYLSEDPNGNEEGFIYQSNDDANGAWVVNQGKWEQRAVTDYSASYGNCFKDIYSGTSVRTANRIYPVGATCGALTSSTSFGVWTAAGSDSWDGPENKCMDTLYGVHDQGAQVTWAGGGCWECQNPGSTTLGGFVEIGGSCDGATVIGDPGDDPGIDPGGGDPGTWLGHAQSGACLGDFNTDNKNDLIDFSTLATYYRQQLIGTDADLDMVGDDDILEVSDFSVFATNYLWHLVDGATCPQTR